MTTENKPLQKILIINAEIQTNRLLNQIIQSMGFTVLVSESLENAQQYFSMKIPSLIIINENIAAQQNFTWIKSIRQKYPLLPIILYTISEKHQTLKQALRLGINDYLSTPLTREDIQNSIQANLSQSQTLRNYVLLESRRATQQLQARVNDLETLTDLARMVTSSLDVDIVLRMIVEAAVELTGAEEGSLLLIDENTGELYMRASRNFNEDFVSTFRLPVNDSLIGSVVKNGKVVIFDDNTPQKIKTSYLVHSLVYIPLKLKEQIIGVLGVDNRNKRMVFSQRDIGLLTTMAEYAVIAIENSRIFSEMVAERTKLETIINQIEDGVLVLDNDFRILIINEIAKTVLRVSGEKLVGSPIQMYPIDSELLEIIKKFETYLGKSAEINTDDERIFSAHLSKITNIGYAITLHDITSLKKMDRIKSDFVSTVSHDLRSPLTAILGYVDLVERAGPVQELQKNFLDRIQFSVHNITNLVDDLLNLGRIEAGFDTRKEPLDLSVFIHQAIDELNPKFLQSNIRLKINVPDSSELIFASPIQMRQLLNNLLTNAIKYSKPDTNISVNLITKESQLILQIADQGFGIPAVDLPYIFDKFYRSGNVIGTEIPGSGLGLAIVKSIVESHHGRIWVDSTVGQGSTFTVVIPISE
ncbi:MAG: GAF domain-containing protein [Anaerolineaceae bacterium]|nr:GAF domain-containing protein [Anaerolineaceae bacterium]